MLTDVELAYLAGFVDADGSIGVVTVAKTKQYVGQIAVSNCNKAIIDLFVKHFGGRVRKRHWKNPKWKPNYEWKLTAKKAAFVIDAIRPFLFIKSRQAELVLELQNIKSKNSSSAKRWHPELKTNSDMLCRSIKEQCLALNQRGQ
jgi:hypothetical protein